MFSKPLRDTNVKKSNCFSKRLPGLLCMILSSRLSLSETQTYRNVCLLHRICPAPLTAVPLLPNLAALNLALMKAFITCKYDARRSPEVDALLR